MTIYKKFSYFFLFIIFVSVVISFCLYSIQMFAHSKNPEVNLKPFTFAKILSRTVTIILFIALIWFRKRIDKKNIRSLGLENFSERKEQLWKGFLAGILSLGLVVAVKVFWGVSTWSPKTLGFPELLLSFYFLGAVFCIGFVEELFFRGYLLQSWITELGEKKAALYTSLFFSGTHFIRPISDPLVLVPEFIGLFLVGYALSLAWIYTRSLYLSTGIHAGWVYIVKMQSFFVDPIPHDMHWVFGGDRLVTGITSWFFMFVFLWFLKKSFEKTIQTENTEAI